MTIDAYGELVSNLYLLAYEIDLMLSAINHDTTITRDQIVAQLISSLNLANFDAVTGGGIIGSNGDIDYAYLVQLLDESLSDSFKTTQQLITGGLQDLGDNIVDIVGNMETGGTVDLGNITQQIEQVVGQYSSQTQAMLGDLGDIIQASDENVIGQTKNMLNSSTYSLSNVMKIVGENTLDSIESSFQNTSDILSNQTSLTLNKLSDTESALLQAMQSLGYTPIESTTVESSSAWTEGYIVDLLSVLADMYNYFRQGVLNIAITGTGGDSNVNINPNTGAGGIDLNNIDWLSFFEGMFGVGGSAVFESVVDDSDKSFVDIIDVLLHPDKYGIETYDDILEYLKQPIFQNNLINLIWNVAGGLFFFIQMGNSIASPFLNNIETIARSDALDGLLPPAIIQELWVRQIFDADTAYNLFKKLGYTDDEAYRYYQSGQIQLPEAFLREAYLRELIDKDLYDDLMVKLGFKVSDLDVIRQTYLRIPPIPDLIRFAVREAYNETLASQLNLDSGYDEIKERFERDLKQNGLSPEYGQMYWRSHWNLPSPTQGYEMLHRDVIDEDELKDLLKVSDYSPTWVQKLIDISYTPLTRVDVRRIHAMLGKDRDWLIQQYKEGGYNQTNAELMADFTIEYNSGNNPDKEKDLSESVLLRAYGVSLLERDTVSTMLQQRGYTEREATILLDMVDLSKQVDLREDVTKDNRRRIINAVSKQFIEGTINEADARDNLRYVGYTDTELNSEIGTLLKEREILRKSESVKAIMQGFIEFRFDDSKARTELARLNFSPYEENELIALWMTQRNLRFKEPTKAELKKWALDGHVTMDEYRNYLKAMGYDNHLVDLYEQDILDARSSQE